MFSILGPGATNLITGTADANSDGAPLVAITGQVGTERMHLTSHQYLNLVELFAPRNHTIIHIDSRPAHINKLFQPETEEFLKLKQEMAEEYESYGEDTSFPMKPQKILHDVRKFMGEDDIVISDVGAHKMWIAREYNCYKPNTCIISNVFATMGIAIPGAVVAKLIHPDKKVLAISGDGGFMMNSQEYETALRDFLLNRSQSA